MYDDKTKIVCISFINKQQAFLINAKELPVAYTCDSVIGIRMENRQMPDGSVGMNIVPFPLFDLPDMIVGPHTVPIASIMAFHTMTDEFKDGIIQMANAIEEAKNAPDEPEPEEPSRIEVATSIPPNMKTFNPSYRKL